MAGIPSSAIKLFTAASGGTEVTTGPTGTVVYARIPSAFVETLTTTSKSISFPYYGRISISGTKTFTCSGDSKTLTVSIPAYAGNHTSNTSVLGLNLLAITSGTASYAFATGIAASKVGQSFAFSFDSNMPKVGITKEAGAWLTINSMTVNAITAPVDGSEYTVPNDTGRVKIYTIVVTVTVTSNTDLSDRMLGIIFSSDAAEFMSVDVTQSSEAIVLSTNSVNVATDTGLSSTAITVTSDSTFTIS